MKKLFFLIIGAVLIMTSCQSHAKPQSNDTESNCIGDYSVRSDTLFGGENGESVQEVSIPVLSNESFDCEKANSLLKRTVTDYIKNCLIGDDTELRLNYEIKYMKSNRISILFNGTVNSKLSAHPSALLFGVNIDVERGCTVPLGDLIKGEDEFEELLKQKLHEQCTPEVFDYIEKMYGQQYLTDCLETNIYNYFYDESSYSIIFATSHAIGDYVTIEIPFAGS